MKPFPQSSPLTPDMKQYNYRISQARIVVENVYGRLKGRWRRLMKRIDMHIDHIPNIVAAACILHNLCEIHKKHFNSAWLQELSCSSSQLQPFVARDGSSGQAKHVRDALVHCFRSN